jgi:CRP-like cAMP-binding protein
MASTPIQAADNRLLAALSPDELDGLLPAIREVRLRQGQVLFDTDAEVAHVLFPLDCVISFVTTLEDGGSVEAALVGKEGMAGAWLAAHTSRSPWRAIAQSDGTCLDLEVPTFLALVSSNLRFQALTLRLLISQHFLTSQSVACNRFHALAPRAARWLLMFADRVGDEFSITQEFLSQMLGVYRPSVSLALASLEESHLIRRTRGRITITDRVGLEAASCECYRRVREHQRRALEEQAID